MDLYLILGIIGLIAIILLLIYNLGKSAKEKQVINNNLKLKKAYENNKNHINNSNALSDKLQKGNY